MRQTFYMPKKIKNIVLFLIYVPTAQGNNPERFPGAKSIFFFLKYYRSYRYVPSLTHVRSEFLARFDEFFSKNASNVFIFRA